MAAEDTLTAQTTAVMTRNEAAFGRGALDGVIANYAEDAVLVRPGKVYRGRTEIRAMFAEVFAHFAGLTPQSNSITVAGRLALLTWTATSTGGRLVQGVDSFVIENDQIVLQSYVGAL
jgi:uncharacterized protein (TIGR02246 family)